VDCISDLAAELNDLTGLTSHEDGESDLVHQCSGQNSHCESNGLLEGCSQTPIQQTCQNGLIQDSNSTNCTTIDHQQQQETDLLNISLSPLKHSDFITDILTVDDENRLLQQVIKIEEDDLSYDIQDQKPPAPIRRHSHSDSSGNLINNDDQVEHSSGEKRKRSASQQADKNLDLLTRLDSSDQLLLTRPINKGLENLLEAIEKMHAEDATGDY